MIHRNVMLQEEDILFELKYYQKFHKAYLKGKRETDLPALPENKDCQNNTLYAALGLLLHTVLAIYIGIARLFRLHKL